MPTTINMTAQRRIATVGFLTALSKGDTNRAAKNKAALNYISSQGTFIQCAAFTGYKK